MTLSFIAEKLSVIKVFAVIDKPFRFFGSITFEVYLVHIVLFRVIHKYVDNGSIKAGNYIWVLAMIVSVIGAVILHVIVKWVKKIVLCVTK